MKITFIGVGAAFTAPEYYQSNMLITARSGKKLLLDCGSDARFSLGTYDVGQENSYKEIDAIYISHLHSDHIGGLEWLAFATYFVHKQHPSRLKLFMEQHLMYEMWDHSLKGGLKCIEGKMMHLTDYFDCRPLAVDGSFQWESIMFTLIEMPHVITGYHNHYSYGLVLREKHTPSVFITTDTQFCPARIIDIAKTSKIIFHDCETSTIRTDVHAHYDELCTLPPDVKSRMWLYHYQPHPHQTPQQDGFKGFVVKGQEFDF